MDIGNSENCSVPFIPHEKRTSTTVNLSKKTGFVLEALWKVQWSA